MTTITLRPITHRRHWSLPATLTTGLRSTWDTACRMWRVWRSRQELAGFDDRMLGDIGLSRSDAHAEASRWFWDFRPLKDDSRARRYSYPGTSRSAG